MSQTYIFNFLSDESNFAILSLFLLYESIVERLKVYFQYTNKLKQFQIFFSEGFHKYPQCFKFQKCLKIKIFNELLKEVYFTWTGDTQHS